MKHSLFTPLLIAGWIILTLQVYAQPTIDSLKLIPANPTANDALKVVCYTTFPYGGCGLNIVSAQQQGNNILLSMDYDMGLLAYICHSVDTIPLSNPGPGDYWLIASLTVNEQEMIVDIDSLDLHIDSPLGIQSLHKNPLQVYPNPFEHGLDIKTTFPVKQVEIRSITGQQVFIQPSPDENTYLDFSGLEAGTYLISVTDPTGQTFTQQVTKLP